MVAWPPGWSVGERALLHQDLNFPLLFSPLGRRLDTGACQETADPTLPIFTSQPARLLPVAVRCNCDCDMALGAWPDVALAIASGQVRGLRGGFREICPGQSRMRPLVLASHLNVRASAWRSAGSSLLTSHLGRHQGLREQADLMIQGQPAVRAMSKTRALLQGDATFTAPCPGAHACVDSAWPPRPRQLSAS